MTSQTTIRHPAVTIEARDTPDLTLSDTQGRYQHLDIISHVQVKLYIQNPQHHTTVSNAIHWQQPLNSATKALNDRHAISEQQPRGPLCARHLRSSIPVPTS